MNNPIRASNSLLFSGFCFSDHSHVLILVSFRARQDNGKDSGKLTLKTLQIYTDSDMLLCY